MQDLEYEVLSLPFDCYQWHTGKSFIQRDGKTVELGVSPFSAAFEGVGDIECADTLDQIKTKPVSICSELILKKCNIVHFLLDKVFR